MIVVYTALYDSETDVYSNKAHKEIQFCYNPAIPHENAIKKTVDLLNRHTRFNVEVHSCSNASITSLLKTIRLILTKI